jgi:predicted MFS family arabinose efflux permease
MRVLPRVRVIPSPARGTSSAGWALSSPSVVLFLALFSSQAGVLVLSPILSDVAKDFDVSISTAGQLRILAAPLAAVVAIAVGRSLGRFSARALLGAGTASLAVGSLASAAAPTFELLALAQIPVWTGVAALIAAGVAAAGAWSSPERRSKVVATALAGPPAAWIVGMPLIGLIAEVHWRLAFVVLPLPAALLTGLALAARPADQPGRSLGSSLAGLLGNRSARSWALGELLANAAWAGTLVFSGALFTEIHGTSPKVTGLALAFVAVAYLLGNVWSGRGDDTRARRGMLEASVVSAVAIGLVWAITPNLATTLALFSIAAFAAAARTVSGTVYGFRIAGDRGREVGAVRAATTQIGYLVGSLVGGVALAAGGFAALGLAYGGLFLAATLPYVCIRATCRSRAALEAAA